MISMSIAEVAKNIKATIVGNLDSQKMLNSISTDTRTLLPGDLFFALLGENFDGHNFLEKACQNGALAVVAEKMPSSVCENKTLLVNNSLNALGDLAQAILQKTRVKVAAITGSNGKTTTKEFLASIMQLSNDYLASQGNFNNLIGLPLTVFGLTNKHQGIILEMGMNNPGEIARLTKIAKPKVAIITAINEAHLGNFTDINELAKAKGELYRGLDKSAIAVVNYDDPLVLKEAKNFSGKHLYFGIAKKAEIRMDNWQSEGLKGQRFSIFGPDLEKGQEVHLKLLGYHNAYNALAAASAAWALGASWPDILSGLEKTKTIFGRLQIKKGFEEGWKIIDDSYNANPSSVSAGLKVLAELKSEKTLKTAILGDMGELGKNSLSAHQAIGKLVADLRLDYLAVVGELASGILNEAIKKGFNLKNGAAFTSSLEAARWLSEKIENQKAYILVKASRNMALDKAVDKLIVREQII